MWLYCLIFSIAGAIVGFLVATLIDLSKSSYGVLRIDDTDPDKKLYRFEINDLKTLDKHDRITLKITRK
jgi:hypothetical protein